MNENDLGAVIAAAWAAVQITRLGLTYRAGKRRADLQAKTFAAKENKP